jgi:serine/threonine-protein kinase
VPVEQDPFLGRTIVGRYRLDARIGHGGMGSVYRAEHVLMGKTVAVKLLHGDMARVPQAVKRFEREARSMSKLDHPNLVAATDFGETEEGILFLVLEYLEGPTLARVLHDDKRFAPRRALRIGRQMLGALEAAHRVGIVHRDLKPDNVILVDRPDDPEFAKILDFGIAKILHDEDDKETLTRTGMVFGTPEYLSPEQGLGQHADHRADLYSMSVIMYEMLTGVRPFRAESKLDIIAMHLTADPEPMKRLASDIPPGVEEVVLKGLAKKADDRWPDALTYSRALDDAIAAADASPSLAVQRSPSGSIVSIAPGRAGLATGESVTRTARAIETARDAGRVMGGTLGRLTTKAFWASLRNGGWQRPEAVASLALGLAMVLTAVTAAVLVGVNLGAVASPVLDGGTGTAADGRTTGTGTIVTLGSSPLLKAQKLSAEGKNADALLVLKAGLVDHPDDPSLHRAIGDVQARLGHWPEAVAAYGEAVKRDPKMRDDPALLAAGIAHLDDDGEDPKGARDLKATKTLLEKTIGVAALARVRDAVTSSHEAILKLRGKAKTTAAAKKRLKPDKVRELNRLITVRLNARRTLEVLGGCFKDAAPPGSSATCAEVDVLPMVIDEMRDQEICAEIQAYVTKLKKMGDVRALPALQELEKKGYDPKRGGNKCLEKDLPAAITDLMPR